MGVQIIFMIFLKVSIKTLTQKQLQIKFCFRRFIKGKKVPAMNGYVLDITTF